MERTSCSILVMIAMLGFSGVANAQFGTGSPVNAEPLVNGPGAGS